MKFKRSSFLTGGIALLTLLIIVIGTLSSLSLEHIQSIFKNVISNETHIATKAYEARMLVLLHRRYEKDIFLHIGNPKLQKETYVVWLRNHEAEMRHILKEIAILTKNLSGFPRKLQQQIAALPKTYDMYNKGLFSVVKVALSMNRQITAKKANQKMIAFKKFSYQLEHTLELLVYETKRRLSKVSQEAIIHSEQNRNVVWIICLIAGFVALVAAYFTIKIGRELRVLRNYLSNIIDSMPSMLVGVDIEGKVTQWNFEARRVTGVMAEEAMGQPLEQLIPHLAAEKQRMHEAIQKREVKSDVRQAREADGETHYEDITIYPLIANGVNGAVLRVDDVTEQVRIEEMMIQSEKMLSVGGLAAGMAHEINNPLSGMIQTACVISDRLTKLDIAANQRSAKEAGTSMEAIQKFMEARGIIKMLGNIRNSGSRAAEIVQNMLQFARKSDSSKPSSFDIMKLLDQSVELARADYDLKKKFDFRKIKIVREYVEDLPFLDGESSKIQQVFLNILRNGAEAMQSSKEERDPQFILRLMYESELKMVRVEIEDNGPGMPENVRKRIFEPFFTTKLREKGTGLGLSISYFIVTENHNGEMSVESQSGVGTKFIIRLPA